MTFFTQAISDGAIDEKVNMTQKEFERMIQGMVQESNIWQLHANKHRDAHIVPTFQEESEFENKIKGKGNIVEESSLVQYDMHSKKFEVGCQCGQKFKIDVNKDEVTTADPNLKMKEMGNYDNNINNNPNNDPYFREKAKEGNYALGPKINSNSGYESKSQYK